MHLSTVRPASNPAVQFESFLNQLSKDTLSVRGIERVSGTGVTFLPLIFDMMTVTIVPEGVGHDFDSAAQEEHRRQAANNMTVQNIFTSLRRISDYNWEDWFEQLLRPHSLDQLKLEFQPLSPVTGWMRHRSCASASD